MGLAHDTSISTRTSDVKINNDVTFDTMLLKETTLLGLRRAGFLNPSPIQLHGIPLGKCGFDLLLEAKSGTGKTAVFTIIALEKLDLEKGLQAVILAPTREIAAQICDVIKEIGVGYEGLCVEVVMGGMPVLNDIEKFKSGRRVHILVGSPGRLRHLVQDKHIDTSSIRLLVLDEADKLVERSFQADINYIFSVLPKQKQVILSSATYPESSKEFISKYVDNSQHICPDSTSILMGISQKVTTVAFNSNVVKQTKLRYEELLKVLTNMQFKQCLIFCNYQVRVTELHRLLTRDKWPAEQLYGLQQQTDRLDALKTLQEYKCRILISTDLAARGIDASNVDLVVNFEPPYEWPTYLHRIGRAGRYGSYGTAITILSQGKEETKFRHMLGGMQDSINLSELWTNNDYNNMQNVVNTPSIKNKKREIVAQCETKASVTEIPKSPIFKELWKEIIGSAETTKKIENFDELVHSFEKTEVQSFSELLNSFESATDDVYEDLNFYSNNYKCLSIQVDSINLHEFLKHLSRDTSLITNVHQPSKQKEEGIVQIKSREKENLKMEISNESPLKCSVKPLKTNGELTNYVKKENKNVSCADDDESAMMLRMGLPTSFWSKQDRKKHERIKYKDQYFTCIKNFNGHTQPDEINNNLSLDHKNKSDRPVVNENNNSRSHIEPFPKNNLKQEVIQNTDFKTTKVLRSPSGFNPKTSKANSKISPELKATKTLPEVNATKLKRNRHTVLTTDNFHQTNYLNWYKQLKLRTQQIEMAVYLEELSKL